MTRNQQDGAIRGLERLKADFKMVGANATTIERAIRTLRSAVPDDHPAHSATALQRARNAVTTAPLHDIMSSPPVQVGERLADIAVEAYLAALPAPEAVAWRVRDFGDGWILFHDEARARHEAKDTGQLVQPLYALPAPATGGALEAALRRLLLEFDFMIERGVIPDVRNDIIFVQAREALSALPPSAPDALDAGRVAHAHILEHALERIGASRMMDFDTLHPSECARVAREALAEWRARIAEIKGGEK